MPPRGSPRGGRELRCCPGHLYVTRDLGAEWSVADSVFHRKILEIAQNPTRGRILTAINDALWETVIGVRCLHHPDTLASYHRHEAIFKAILARDPVAAQAAMRAHFDAMSHVIVHLSGQRAGVA